MARTLPGETPSQHETLSDDASTPSVPPYIQLPLIANADVVYEVDFDEDLADDNSFTGRFSDVPAGTVVQLEYQLTTGTAPTVDKVVGGVTLPLVAVPIGQLPMQTETAWSWNPTRGVLTLRVVQESVEDDVVVTR